MKFGERILEQADRLAAFTQDEGRLTRTYLTPQHKQAGEQIAAWMREAGMEAGFDALGNVVGRYEGSAPGAPVILTGSHMDSVVDAGRYDGIFGILSPIACVRDLHQRGKRLPVTIEVVAFGDEEGVRFGVTMIGSRAMAGRLRPEMLEAKDRDGITLREALVAFGGRPDAIPMLARTGIAAFVESHIEQGPVLLEAGLPVGVVTSIAGGYRVRARVTGTAGHAGTVPMPARKDALMAAAEMALAIEAHCAAQPLELVGTVGKLSVAGGGAVNVIPGTVEFTVDLRSGDDAVRRRAHGEVRDKAMAIAARRGVQLDWDPFFELEAAPCDPSLRSALAGSIRAQGLPVRELPSGAGHDAMELGHAAPMAMLFVRCGNGGISHNPLETMTAEDAELATSVLLHFFENYRP